MSSLQLAAPGCRHSLMEEHHNARGRNAIQVRWYDPAPLLPLPLLPLLLPPQLLQLLPSAAPLLQPPALAATPTCALPCSGHHATSLRC